MKPASFFIVQGGRGEEGMSFIILVAEIVLLPDKDNSHGNHPWVKNRRRRME